MFLPPIMVGLCVAKILVPGVEDLPGLNYSSILISGRAHIFLPYNGQILLFFGQNTCKLFVIGL